MKKTSGELSPIEDGQHPKDYERERGKISLTPPGIGGWIVRINFLLGLMIILLPMSSMAQPAMPAILGCSADQHVALRDLYIEAYQTIVRAERFIDSIMKEPRAQRKRLWNQDGNPSPAEFFGSYDTSRAQFVQRAIQKARERFEGKGVVPIRKLRCGRPLLNLREDEEIDKCTQEPGGYHFPLGTIVTCSAFWGNDNPGRIKTFVHEVFHWLSVNALYVTDYHGDGVGRHPDIKYYWWKIVDGQYAYRYLAENKPSWAIRTNDNYALFITKFL